MGRSDGEAKEEARAVDQGDVVECVAEGLCGNESEEAGKVADRTGEGVYGEDVLGG